MCERSETTITFSAGQYAADRTSWLEAPNAPTATVSVATFRLLFDAAGDETIDTTGDIDPEVLLGIVGLGPRGAEDATAWVRLVARWARRRRLRVGFDVDEPTEDRPQL